MRTGKHTTKMQLPAHDVLKIEINGKPQEQVPLHQSWVNHWVMDLLIKNYTVTLVKHLRLSIVPILSGSIRKYS